MCGVDLRSIKGCCILQGLNTLGTHGKNDKTADHDIQDYNRNQQKKQKFYDMINGVSGNTMSGIHINTS